MCKQALHCIQSKCDGRMARPSHATKQNITKYHVTVLVHGKIHRTGNWNRTVIELYMRYYSRNWNVSAQYITRERDVTSVRMGKGRGRAVRQQDNNEGPGVLKTDHHKEPKKVPLRGEGECAC